MNYISVKCYYGSSIFYSVYKVCVVGIFIYNFLGGLFILISFKMNIFFCEYYSIFLRRFLYAKQLNKSADGFRHEISIEKFPDEIM